MNLLNIIVQRHTNNNSFSQSMTNQILSTVSKIIKRSWFDFTEEVRNQFLNQILFLQIQTNPVPNTSYIQFLSISLAHQIISEFSTPQPLIPPLFLIKTFISFQVCI